ncbi:hypothetical protein [Methylobacterium nigriterrae]|uniref:hypothetical protein n=1 Tax=Methylobacterium nigriterrae TaxID=3127512 RepID=UPI0030134A18
MDKNHQIIDEYGEWISERRRNGWDGYFLTFMFNQLRGNRGGRLIQMEKEVERVYATLLTRVVREPTHEKSKDQLPRWIICPDLPVPKRERMSLREATVNDGLHLQGIGLFPARSRLKEPLDQHFSEHQDLYVKVGGPLRSVAATPIIATPKRMVEYGFKAIPRRTASFDDVLILPRALSEIKDQQMQ